MYKNKFETSISISIRRFIQPYIFLLAARSLLTLPLPHRCRLNIKFSISVNWLFHFTWNRLHAFCHRNSFCVCGCVWAGLPLEPHCSAVLCNPGWIMWYTLCYNISEYTQLHSILAKDGTGTRHSRTESWWCTRYKIQTYYSNFRLFGSHPFSTSSYTLQLHIKLFFVHAKQAAVAALATPFQLVQLLGTCSPPVIVCRVPHQILSANCLSAEFAIFWLPANSDATALSLKSLIFVSNGDYRCRTGNEKSANTSKFAQFSVHFASSLLFLLLLKKLYFSFLNS